MSQRNKNNSIIFLTTLSVYLGLVLVGVTPQVLAQQTKIISRQSKTAEIQVIKSDCSETSIAEILELLAKYDVNQIPLGFTYQVNYSENKSPSLEILLAEGDKLFVESLRQIVTCNINLHKQFDNTKSQDKNSEEFKEALLKALFPFSSVLYDYKANNQEIVSNAAFSFATNDEAKNYAESAITQSRKIETPELIAKNRLVSVFLKNTNIRYENNQVFIVTRLPRGSLDELLKQDAKAASK